MKIALIGYGKMGRTIQRIAQERGHQIVAIIDKDNQSDFASDAFRDADVAIEFSVPQAAWQNYQQCFAAHIPVVAGTTGWLDKMDSIKSACADGKQTFFYASNFSIGVNIFFALNQHVARVMNNYPNYKVRMEETHHMHKLDAPSGTAISLAEDIIEANDSVQNWIEGESQDSQTLPIFATREGVVPGYHAVIYESDVDSIQIAHNAKSREGFALGAVIAAEYTVNKKGFLTMQDMLQF